MKAVRNKVKRGGGHRRDAGPWVTYQRCFLLTMGTLLGGVGLLGFTALSRTEAGDGPWLPLLFGGLLLLGIYQIGIGLFGSRRKATSLYDDSSGSDASLVVMLVAAPLYFVLKAIGKKR